MFPLNIKKTISSSDNYIQLTQREDEVEEYEESWDAKEKNAFGGVSAITCGESDTNCKGTKSDDVLVWGSMTVLEWGWGGWCDYQSIYLFYKSVYLTKPTCWHL